MKTNGTEFTVMHAFGGWDGTAPNSLQLSGTTLYGTTAQGGANTYGTVFSIGIDGSGFSVLYQFSAATGSSIKTNADGINPVALVVTGDTLYGMSSLGGANGGGTIFSLNTGGGSFSVLHDFGPTGTTTDGNEPLGELTATGGQIYGTTIHGGSNRRGIVFSISTNGSAFALVHSFNHTDGDEPYGGVVLSGNTLYGTTIEGGSGNHGIIFAVNTDGGSYNVLYNFSPYAANNNTNTDGAMPEAGLVLSGHTLYGATAAGGAGAAGTAFNLEILPSITSVVVNGGNLVLDVANAVVGSRYVVLKSNDPAKPFNQWTPIVTNAPSSTGNIVITATEAVDPQEPQAFYTLKVQ
jgi:uncharacterized repeat protein (TIGR03803 family)